MVTKPIQNVDIRIKTLFMSQNLYSIFVIGFMLLASCASPAPEKQGPTRDKLDEIGDKTIAAFIAAKPQLQELLNKSVGYTVVNMSITKIPVVGTGVGYGVVIDRRTGTRSYIRVTQFEIGGGIGTEKYKVLIIFDDAKLLDKAIVGAWHYDAGAQATAGVGSADTSASRSAKGYQAFKLTESGTCVRVTVLLARAKPYLVDQRE